MSPPLSVSERSDDARARSGLRLRPILLGLLAILLLAAAGQYGWHYWHVGRFMVDTDDAYVQADSVMIAPRVGGVLATVEVADNQAVRQGQVLARIDDRDLRTALNQATADRESAERDIAVLATQTALQQTAIAQAESRVQTSRAALDLARQEDARYANLARTGAGSIQAAQQRSSALLQADATLREAEAALAGARQQIEVLRAQTARAAAQRDRFAAAEQQAALNLSYATITAPTDGVVGARTLRVGQYVQPGTQLMAIVPLAQVYVVANYKETQLTNVRPGQPVTVSVDTYPDLEVRGHVDSLSPATGLQFALLPPDNATGNFTKIVQRLPVRIALDPEAVRRGLLRPGMSVEPVIDTRPARHD